MKTVECQSNVYWDALEKQKKQPKQSENFNILGKSLEIEQEKQFYKF